MSKYQAYFNYFNQNFHNLLAHRSYSIRMAIILFMMNKGKVIVETGTLRVLDQWSDGQATLVLGKVTQFYPSKLFSVDIDENAVDASKEATKDIKNVTITKSDSVEYLKKFKQKIDLLYLDSMDCPTEGDATESQAHCFNELKAAEKNIHDKTVIVIDDAKWPNGGKAKLAREYLLSKGWEIIPFEYQDLFIFVGK